jgi:hypothetical protein
MKHRKLRFAWSVAWGIVAVLLVALWVRSYHHHDVAYFRIPFTNVFGGDSRPGTIHVSSGNTPTPMRWGLDSEYLTTEQMKMTYRMSAPTDPMNEVPNRLGFGFTHPFGWTTFVIPHWVPVLSSILFALVIWLPGRFSLRTLLIAITLAALALRGVVYFTR